MKNKIKKQCLTCEFCAVFGSWFAVGGDIKNHLVCIKNFNQSKRVSASNICDFYDAAMIYGVKQNYITERRERLVKNESEF